MPKNIWEIFLKAYHSFVLKFHNMNEFNSTWSLHENLLLLHKIHIFYEHSAEPTIVTDHSNSKCIALYMGNQLSGWSLPSILVIFIFPFVLCSYNHQAYRHHQSLTVSQRSIHLAWNLCVHCSIRSLSPSSYSLMQMLHSGTGSPVPSSEDVNDFVGSLSISPGSMPRDASPTLSIRFSRC